MDFKLGLEKGWQHRRTCARLKWSDVLSNSNRTAHEQTPTGERGPPSKPPFHRGLLRVSLMTPHVEVNRLFFFVFCICSRQFNVLFVAVVLYSANVYIMVVYVCSGSVWTAPGFVISKTPRQSDYG